MMVVVFRAHVRADADLEALGALSQRMFALATAMPGFVSYTDCTTEGGENLTVVEFASEAELLGWRNHPEHRDAQERGRREFFADYRIQVCRLEREAVFDAASPQGR